MNNHMLKKAPPKPPWFGQTFPKGTFKCKNCLTNGKDADWTHDHGVHLCSNFCRFIFAYGLDLT